MELLVDFSALAIVELYLGGIAVVARKSKAKLIRKCIGKSDGRKGREDLHGEGHDTPKEALAKVGAACGEGAGDATLTDGLLDVESSGSTRPGASHGADVLVAKRVAVGAAAQFQKEDQDAEATLSGEDDRAIHLGFQYLK